MAERRPEKCATLKDELPGHVRVYALWNDRALIKRIQEVKGKGAEFYHAHGLFGSAGWWNAIERGQLPLHTVRGTICDLDMEGPDDVPRFRILCDDGSVTRSIPRKGMPRLPLTADRRYKIGRDVIWQYVTLGGAKQQRPFTVSIWVAETQTLVGLVSENELPLIVAANFAAFPVQSSEPAIFYALASRRGGRAFKEFLDRKSQQRCGYVIRCEAPKSFIAQYEIAQANHKDHVEYRVPAGDVEAFNRHLVGKINVVSKASGPLPGDATLVSELGAKARSRL
jgi:hypothetical protein